MAFMAHMQDMYVCPCNKIAFGFRLCVPGDCAQTCARCGRFSFKMQIRLRSSAPCRACTNIFSSFQTVNAARIYLCRHILGFSLTSSPLHHHILHVSLVCFIFMSLSRKSAVKIGMNMREEIYL